MKTLYSYRPSLPFTIFPQSCHAVFIFLFSFCIQSFEIVAQTPVAKFTFLRTKTCIKTTGDAVVVSFKDESLGGAHSSEWAFGDGGTSSNPNPSRTYTAAGVYYVTLTVTIADQSSSITQQVVIFPEPEVKFTSDINSGCPPLKVVFTDLTKALEIKDPLNGNVYKEELSSRDWTFGDGTPVITDIVGSVTHTYTTAGSRDVGLTVTSEGGCKVFASSLKGFIKVFEPAAPDFYLPPPTTCQYPVTVTATNNSVGSTTFKWSSTVPSAVTISDPAAENPSFTFSIPGNYTIKLITATVNGCIGEKEFNYFLPPTNITASFTSINNTCANTTVKFTNTSNPEPISNKWFIDGVQVGNQKDLSYPFPTAGSFLVRLETQIGGG
jgi:PKD repeat protein